MNTHQTQGRQYCRAIKINKPSDHPGIVVDPDGFDGTRIKVDGSGGTHWKSVPRGGFVLERDGVVVGVLSEGDFSRMWEPIPPKPATRTVVEAAQYSLTNEYKHHSSGRIVVDLPADEWWAFIKEQEDGVE